MSYKILKIFLIVASFFNISLCFSSAFELTEKFKEIDVNNDGFITMNDLMKVYGDKMTFEEGDLFFEKFDSNKDGAVSLEEFLNNWNSLSSINKS